MCLKQNIKTAFNEKHHRPAQDRNKLLGGPKRGMELHKVSQKCLHPRENFRLRKEAKARTRRVRSEGTETVTPRCVDTCYVTIPSHLLIISHFKYFQGTVHRCSVSLRAIIFLVQDSKLFTLKWWSRVYSRDPEKCQAFFLDC